MTILYNLDADQYHSGPEISNSGLRDFARSPFHYYSLHRDPKRPPRAVKAGQLEGTLAHCATLEPGEFDKRFATGPSVNRNTNAWKDFVASLPGGVTAIQQEQRDVAFAQAASVRAIEDVAALLSSGGAAEVSVYWNDPETGVGCRARPDYAAPAGDGVILLDLKTYSDSSPEEFRRQIARKAYHCQDALYSDGYALASGEPVLGFVFVAVETAWPYVASAVMLDDASREQGRQENRALLDAYAECLKTDVWPSYTSMIELVSLPQWAMTP
jgi:PDDEXK-like domain of unknown function (DUF3799)